MLSDVRVLELGVFLPVPYATRWMAYLGAEVIKVEPPGGDPMRALSSAEGYFTQINQGKTLRELDLRDPDDLATCLGLAATCDVVLEGFRPGVVERLGVGYDAVRALRPDIIYCSISGFDRDGPAAMKAAHDINYLALSGALGRAPSLPALPIVDFTSGIAAVAAVVSALFARERGNGGRHLDVPMKRVADALAAPGLRDDSIATSILGQETPCYGLFETSDAKFLAFGAIEPKFWKAFCDAAGAPELIDRQYSPAAKAAMEQLVRARTRDDWAARLAEVDCCVEPVLVPGEVTVAFDPLLHKMEARHESGL